MSLTMTRNVGQKVILTLPSGEEIVIGVKKANNNDSLRLSIDAPKNVTILREELRN